MWLISASGDGSHKRDNLGLGTSVEGRWIRGGRDGDSVRRASRTPRPVQARRQRVDSASADSRPRGQRPAVADCRERAVRHRFQRRVLGGRPALGHPLLASLPATGVRVQHVSPGTPTTPSTTSRRRCSTGRSVGCCRHPATRAATTCRICCRCISTSARTPVARSTRSAPSSTGTCTSRSTPSSATPTVSTASTTFT